MNKAGFTLVEIMVVVAIIGLLAVIALPSFIKARNLSAQNACINNLRIISNAKDQASLSERLSDGDPIDTVSVNAYIKGNTVPICPGGGSYTYMAIGTAPSCTVTMPTSHAYR